MGVRQILLAAIVSFFVQFENALAMDFTLVPWDDGFVIRMKGDISNGDYERFSGFFMAFFNRFYAPYQQTQRRPPKMLRFFELDSSGGSVEDAFKIARFVETTNLPVMVRSTGQCASAFFFLASSKKRYVGSGAYVGVHRVATELREMSTGRVLRRGETERSSIWTIAGQLYLEDRGIPSYIIEHMRRTPGYEGYRLTEQDLRMMGVVVLEEPSDPGFAGSLPQQRIKP